MQVTTVLSALAVTYGAINCVHLDDYKCYSNQGFCLDHLQRECENGTVCDDAFRKAHPGESPCIDSDFSYGCNKTSYKCVKSLGIFSYSTCRSECHPPSPPTPPAPSATCRGKMDYTCYDNAGFCLNGKDYPCEKNTVCSSTFHTHHPLESPCINVDESYGCVKDLKQCHERIGYQNLTACSEECK